MVYSDVKIQQVENGYIVKIDCFGGRTYVCHNFQEVISRIAEHFDESLNNNNKTEDK